MDPCPYVPMEKFSPSWARMLDSCTETSSMAKKEQLPEKTLDTATWAAAAQRWALAMHCCKAMSLCAAHTHTCGLRHGVCVACDCASVVAAGLTAVVVGPSCSSRASPRLRRAVPRPVSSSSDESSCRGWPVGRRGGGLHICYLCMVVRTNAAGHFFCIGVRTMVRTGLYVDCESRGDKVRREQWRSCVRFGVAAPALLTSPRWPLPTFGGDAERGVNSTDLRTIATWFAPSHAHLNPRLRPCPRPTRQQPVLPREDAHVLLLDPLRRERHLRRHDPVWVALPCLDRGGALQDADRLHRKLTTRSLRF